MAVIRRIYLVPAEQRLLYRSPLGLPLRWQDEQGQLPGVVRAFFSRVPLDVEQFYTLRQYLTYYINAPCWDMPVEDDEEGQAELAARRAEVARLASAEDMERWLYRCLEMGIDPL